MRNYKIRLRNYLKSFFLFPRPIYYSFFQGFSSVLVRVWPLYFAFEVRFLLI